MNGGLTALERAREEFFNKNDLDFGVIEKALAELGKGDADFSDLYFETTTDRSWRSEDGVVAAGGFSVRQGVGGRAAREGRVAFAHSADLRSRSLMETVQAVGQMRSHGDEARLPQGLALHRNHAGHGIYMPADIRDAAEAAETIAILQRINGIARDISAAVVRVEANIRFSNSVVLVANSETGFSADIRPLLRLGVTVVAQGNGKRSRGFAGIGGRHGLGVLSQAEIYSTVERAVRTAVSNLEARPAPVGTMPVVLAPGYPGVLFHEAVGHGLEADHHRKNLSVFTNRIGERIAAPGVTVIDDGTVPTRSGSLGIDDEGTPGQATTLIEDGVLVGLMQDKLNAGLMNARSTGNGRRQSYAHLPMPRMTNTFLAAGEHDPQDILRSVKKGIYARAFGGGQVDIVTGRFDFTTTEAWMIEDGELAHPIDGATLIGVGDKALQNITMIGNDLALDPGEAVCGKQGQMLDVSVGQPTIRIDDMMVGGRKN